MQQFHLWFLAVGFAVVCLFAAPSWAAHHEAGEHAEATEAGEAAAVVNINTADAASLETLPGIGAGKAAAIVQYRDENGPFSAVADLQNVDGIGEVTLEKLKDKVSVGE